MLMKSEDLLQPAQSNDGLCMKHAGSSDERCAEQKHLAFDVYNFEAPSFQPF